MIGLDFLFQRIYKLPVAAAPCEENTVQIHGIVISESVADILGGTFFKAAAVFFAHAHFAIGDFNAGLELEQVRTQSGYAAAAAALVEKFQIVENKAYIHPRNDGANVFRNMLRVRFALCSLLRRKQRKLRYSGGEIAAVHRIDMPQLPGYNACVLIAGGKIRAYGEVDYIISRFNHRSERFKVVCNGNRRGFRQLLVFL